MGSPKNKYRRNFKKISLKEQRSIIDLRIKGLSLNDIVDHFKAVYRRTITIYQIKKLINHCNERAKKMNHFYDSMVSEKLTVVEFDEVYQGREGKIIGGVHKDSLYLLAMDRFQSKSIQEMKQILTPIANRFPHIDIVMTDLLPAYKTVIEEVFVGAIHQDCCVHAQRNIKDDIFPINSAAKKAYKALKELKTNLKEQQDLFKKKKRKAWNYEKRLILWENKRDTYLKDNGIPFYSAIDPSDEVRIKFNAKIGLLRASLRSLRNTISNIEDKIIKYTHDIPAVQEKYDKKLVKRLQAGRLLKRFKKVIYAPSKVFNKEYELFIEMLERNKTDFGKKFYKFIKNNPAIFAVKRSEFSGEILPNYLNTNSIESIFGRYRAFLDKYRTIMGSEFQESIFEILRLHHNFSAPYTGPRSDTSPLERLGVRSKYSNYLDVLFGDVSC